MVLPVQSNHLLRKQVPLPFPAPFPLEFSPLTDGMFDLLVTRTFYPLAQTPVAV